MSVRVIPSSSSWTMLFLMLVVLLALLPNPQQTNAHPVESEPERRVEDASAKRKHDLPWTWNTNQFPNPQMEFGECRQPKPSYLCDPDRKLTAEEASELVQLMERIRNDIPCLCGEECKEEDKGIVVGIAIMGNMFHSYHDDLTRVAQDFAKITMEKWNLGTCGNGLMLVLSTDIKTSFLETGSAVKNLLSEETIADIYNQCVGHLQDGHYSQGLKSILNSVYDKVKTIQSSPRVDEENTSTGSVGLTVGLIVGFAVLGGLFAAGLVMVRRRRQEASNDKFMYDGSGSHSGSRPGSRPGSRGSSGKDASGPIVKNPLVFPDAVYQPCSVNDATVKAKTRRSAGSEDEDETENNEDQYLRNLEENPAYESADTMLASPRTLSAVVEEDSDQHSPKDAETPLASVHTAIAQIRSDNQNDRHRDAYA